MMLKKESSNWMIISTGRDRPGSALKPMAKMKSWKPSSGILTGWRKNTIS